MVEQTRPWMALRYTDTSKSVAAGNTWQTAIDLSTIARFNRFYGEVRNEKKSPSASKFAEPQEKSEQRHALSVSQADIVLSMKLPRRGTLSAAGFL